MPTAQVDTLKNKYGQYLDASAATDSDWYNALNEIMPRVYQMGFWRDMMTTLTEVDVSSGSYTLLAGNAGTGVGYEPDVWGTQCRVKSGWKHLKYGGCVR